jgi:hypothetical protein
MLLCTSARHGAARCKGPRMAPFSSSHDEASGQGSLNSQCIIVLFFQVLATRGLALRALIDTCAVARRGETLSAPCATREEECGRGHGNNLSVAFLC